MIKKYYKIYINISYFHLNSIKRSVMGIGDWGLGIGDWGLGPIPNPQSPIPNPHYTSNIKKKYFNK
jgi:hypothetical protein